MKSKGKGSGWIFTKARKEALAKARAEHSRLVRLGESVDRKKRR